LVHIFTQQLERAGLNDKTDMMASARFASRFFRVMISLKGRFSVEFDEIVIFFGLGRLNFDPTQGPMMFVKPINILSLSEFLAIPRETLRRKLLHLEEKELVQRTSYGYVVKDVASWRRLADAGQGGDAEG
jgi:hypothetical protein